MIVLLQLGDVQTLAQVVRRCEADVLDLRAYVVYPDGRIDVLDVANARRGEHWQELPGTELPAHPENGQICPVLDPCVETACALPPAPCLPAMLVR